RNASRRRHVMVRQRGPRIPVSMAPGSATDSVCLGLQRLVPAAARCYAGVMGWSNGGGLTAAEQTSREQVRLAAADQAARTGQVLVVRRRTFGARGWVCAATWSREGLAGPPSRRLDRFQRGRRR